MASASPSEGYSDAQSTPRSLPGTHGLNMMPPTEKTISQIPDILPRERVFPIQLGSELFKLSGVSLSSDGTLQLAFPGILNRSVATP
jgi:replication factor C subunit 3/5